MDLLNVRIAEEENKSEDNLDRGGTDGGLLSGRHKREAAAIEVELSNRSARQKAWAERIDKVRSDNKSERLHPSQSQVATLFHALNKDAGLYLLFGKVYYLAEKSDLRFAAQVNLSK